MVEYTSIEQVYRRELNFVRLFGGLMFERPKLLNLIYRIIVMALTRYITLRYYYVYVVPSGKYSKSIYQNYRLFWYSYHVVSNLVALVTFVTGTKYHNLLLVIIKKQFDARYMKKSVEHLIKYGGSLMHRRSIWVEHRHGRSSRMKLIRSLIIIHVVLSVLSTCLRDTNYASYGYKYNPTSIAASNSTTTSRARGFLWATNDSSLASLNKTLEASHSDAQPEFKLASQVARRVANLMVKIVRDFISTSLNVCQANGQVFVVLMVTATITDMISYSRAFDGLIGSSAHSREDELESVDELLGAHKYQIQSNQSPSRPPNRVSNTLLTTEILIQARDVLIVLRCIMSLDYLLILILDLIRLMNVFCLFNAAVANGKYVSMILIILEYVRISLGMTLARLGYHWLHLEVRELKQLIDEKSLLNSRHHNDEHDKFHSSNHSSGGSNRHDKMDDNLSHISHSEKITVYRLASDIETLWPTDWFTPDLKGYLKNNIFVITFVATLLQLVEASSKVEYETNSGIE